jgi:hypothetical protein
MGELTNLNQQGASSAAFHACPDMLAFDPYSGDYGSGFWGFAVNTATYIAHDPALGWLSFGGNLQDRRGDITVEPLDAFRNRVYLAPVGLWLTLDAGKVSRVTFDPKSGTVRLTLDPADKFTPEALVRIQQPAKIAGVGSYRPAETFKMERGAYVVPLSGKTTEVILRSSEKHPEK